MVLKAEIKKEVDDVIEDYRGVEKWSLGSGVKFVFAVIPDFCEIVEKAEEMSGAEKKAMVVEALDYTWEELKIDIPWVPDRLLIKMLPYAIDLVVGLINRFDGFKKEQPDG